MYSMREHPGSRAHRTIGLVLAGFALTIDYPRSAQTFWSDGATYYAMAHSLAFDGDLLYEREDLVRVFREFRSGPSGLFLKRGREVDLTLESRIPFLVSEGPLTSELYYAKAFLYSSLPLLRARRRHEWSPALHAFSDRGLFAGYSSRGLRPPGAAWR
jgi:hypothetical protein